MHLTTFIPGKVWQVCIRFNEE